MVNVDTCLIIVHIVKAQKHAHGARGLSTWTLNQLVSRLFILA